MALVMHKEFLVVVDSSVLKACAACRFQCLVRVLRMVQGLAQELYNFDIKD